MNIRKARTPTYLLDTSVEVALSNSRHTHYGLVLRWLSDHVLFATCPKTQGAIVRAYFREAPAPLMEDAHLILKSITGDANHRFIPDDIDYLAVDGKGLRGHKQVTDAYLVHLARHHKLKLATFDSAQAALYPDVAELLTGEL